MWVGAAHKSVYGIVCVKRPSRVDQTNKAGLMPLNYMVYSASHSVSLHVRRRLFGTS